MANYKNHQLFLSFEKFALVCCNQEILQALGMAERRIDVLIFRIIQKKEFEEIGEIMGLSRERVRQIYDASIRHIGRSISGYIQTLPKIDELQDVINGLQVQLETYRGISAQQEEMSLRVAENPSLLIPLEDMGLSTRTYNVLYHRAEVRTVYDIAKWTKHDLLKLVNFGNVSLQELEEKLKEYGVVLS
jgi:hypothetical protein